MAKKPCKVAIPVFRCRVAPVLDWCRKICIFIEEPGSLILDKEVPLLNMSGSERLGLLRAEGVKVLICAALSPDLLHCGQLLGLQIICGVAGEVGAVLEAYQANRLDDPAFQLPGCLRADRIQTAGQRRCRCGARMKTGPTPSRRPQPHPVPRLNTLPVALSKIPEETD